MARNEPQSYGSGSRGEEQRGKLSPDQLPGTADTVDTCEVAPDEQPVSKVTTTPGGARRGGAFKDRDYE